MYPLKKFLSSVQIMRICAKICGLDIFVTKYKLNVPVCLGVSLVVSYFICTIYTIQLTIKEDWTIALEAFCMVGSVFQGLSKLLTALRHQNKLKDKLNYLISVYKDNETKGQEYNMALNESASFLSKIIKFCASLHVVTCTTVVFSPFVVWAFTGRRLLVMHFVLPGIDPETLPGYLATVSIQIMSIFCGAFVNFSGDLFMFLPFIETPLLVDIFKLKSKELNALARESQGRQVSEKLSEVIQWHQQYIDFVSSNNHVFFWMNLTEVSTAGLSIVLTLVIVFTGDWIGAYAYIVLCFSLLYVYCGLGTIVKTANERMQHEIYDIQWYYLTASQQKNIRLMLMSSQAAKDITVGGVLPLSYATGLQVTKTIYSVLMMLLKLFA